MRLIANVTITIVQTRPHPLSTSKSYFSVGYNDTIAAGTLREHQVAGGVGQVRTEVNFKFELVA
jgi:hypothetical protein